MKNYRQLSPEGDGTGNGSLPPVQPPPVPPLADTNESIDTPIEEEDDK